MAIGECQCVLSLSTTSVIQISEIHSVIPSGEELGVANGTEQKADGLREKTI